MREEAVKKIDGQNETMRFLFFVYGTLIKRQIKSAYKFNIIVFVMAQNMQQGTDR